MPEPDLPPPERCLHNMHRAADRSGDAAEPTDLCRTDLGVVHMLDCPLFVGRRCAWFADAPVPHPAASDTDIAAARDDLRRDFLGWPYRVRVRNLSRPRELLPKKLLVESLPSPLEEEAPIVLRVPPPAPAADGTAPPAEAAAGPVAGGAAVLASAVAGPVAVPAADANAAEESAGEPSVAPAAAPAVEYYPGQRRSEDRGRKKERRRPKPPIPVSLPAAATDPGIDGETGFGTGIDGAPDEALDTAPPAEPPRPKTVEQLLEILPEAPLTETPPRRDGRGRGGDPRGPRPPRERDRDRGRPVNRGDARGGPARGGRGPQGPRHGDGGRRPERPAAATGEFPSRAGDDPSPGGGQAARAAAGDSGAGGSAPTPRVPGESRMRRRGRRGRGAGGRVPGPGGGGDVPRPADPGPAPPPSGPAS